MKRFMKRDKKGNIVRFVLVAAATMMMAAGNMPGNVVRAEEISGSYGTLIKSGNCGAEGNGDNVKWAVYDSNADEDSDGDILVISGTGEMANYQFYFKEAPWSTYNEQLEKVVVKKGVTSIGDGAFSRCFYLSSITIPEGVKSIGNQALEACFTLSSIEIPSSVTSIGVEAFCGCDQLNQITVSAQNQYFSSANGVLFNKGGTELLCYPTATGEYSIPKGVTSIGDYAFWGCDSLTGITIPEGVTSIGNCAFASCGELSNMIIPKGVTSIGGYAFNGCTRLSSITISESVTSIGDYAFLYCSDLSTIYIKGADNREENKTIAVGENAFYDIASDAIVYLESSSINHEWATEAGLKDEQIRTPYAIVYTLESGTKTTIAEVFADGKQSYTFKGDDLPESEEVSGEWQYKDENKDVIVATGSTINNIGQNIELVIIPLNSYLVDNNIKTVEQVTVLPQGWTWRENDKKKTLQAGQSMTAKARYTGEHKALYATKTKTVTITRATCEETPTPLYTGADEKAPTCTEDGIGHTECSLCHDVINTNIIVPATGHVNKEVRDAKAATCKEEGYTGTTYCKDCETLLAYGSSIPKSTTHTWDTGVETKAATATEKGARSYTCSVCGLTKTEETPASGTSAGIENFVNGYPTAESAEKAITSTNTDKSDVKGSTFAVLQLKATGKKKSVKLSWKKVKGADGYIIYGAQCGKKLKKLTTLEGAGKLTYTQKKLKAGKYYKYMVAAYKNADGKQCIIASSKSAHAVTNGGKYANPTKVSVKSAKMTIKKGKKQTIKASLVMPKGTKFKTHIAKFRYESSNEKVAKVSKKGVVTAKNKGTAYIYVYAQNGVCKKVKVSVK